MKRILLFLVCISILSCGDKDSKEMSLGDEVTPLGKWQEEYFSDDSEFKVTYTDIPVGYGYLELNDQDSCQHGGILRKPNKYDQEFLNIFHKSFCDISDKTIKIIGGVFFVDFGKVKSGSTIYIDKLTKDEMILKINLSSLLNPYNKLNNTYCYSKWKRIE